MQIFPKTQRVPGTQVVPGFHVAPWIREALRAELVPGI